MLINEARHQGLVKKKLVEFTLLILIGCGNLCVIFKRQPRIYLKLD